MPALLDIDNTFFTVIGYPMSYIEFFGTIAYLLSVWLVAKRNMLTWPIGIFSVILYCLLFLQINLYADMVEQAYFLGMSLYGWWYWNRTLNQEDEGGLVVSSRSLMVKCLAITIVGGVGFGFFLMNADNILPKVFTEPASYPMIDAITTVASFVAMWLLSRKRVESWVYWIVIDVVAIWLYFIKDVKFLSLLYVILLGIAIKGWLTWRRRPRPLCGFAMGIPLHDWHHNPMAMLDRDHSDFIGVDTLIQQNADQLAQFRTFAENHDWQSFHSNHYDWWAFPIGSPSSHGYRYSVSKESVEVLKQSPQFLSNLSESADLLLLSWGWDSGKNENLATVDSGQAWAHWPIRLYKAWRSMQIFGLTEREISLSTYAHYLRENEYSFEYQGRDLFESISAETVKTKYQGGSTIEEFNEFFEKEALDVPMVAAHLEDRLIEYREWHWATQPTPAPIDDYGLTDTVEYLKGPVRDQYSVSHGGYGLNSYSLNFRHVSGELAMIVQCLWGGVYGDRVMDSADWNRDVLRINSLLATTASASDEERVRRYLLVASNFRSGIQFLERTGSNWETVEQVNTWDAVHDYLRGEQND